MNTLKIYPFRIRTLRLKYQGWGVLQEEQNRLPRSTSQNTKRSRAQGSIRLISLEDSSNCAINCIGSTDMQHTRYPK